MRVDAIMKTDVVFVAPETPIFDAIDTMRQREIRHLPVLDDCELVGIITDRDIRLAFPSIVEIDTLEQQARVLPSFASRTVSDFMTGDIECIGPRSSVEDAVYKLLAHRIGGLPVMDDGNLVGIVTESDLLEVLMEKLKETTTASFVQVAVRQTPGAVAGVRKAAREIGATIRRTSLLNGRIHPDPVLMAHLDTPELETLKASLLEAGLELVGERTCADPGGGTFGR